MLTKDSGKKNNFGTLPVFITSISTILGAILFLRFGWAVGNLGFYGVVGIILVGHLVSIPTAYAVAEIATNQKVMGGGAYYIISRSFGLNIGASVGITLYLSQAISVAFYVIAFAEAFDPLLEYIKIHYGWWIYDKRAISLPTMAILSYLVLTRGANIGMKALYVVVSILFLSLILFFLGHPIEGTIPHSLGSHIENGQNFFLVFTIVFPAFTGMAAGLGLSGDLKDPKKSIPQGTLWATFAGMIIYLLVAYKLASSASQEELLNNQLVMQEIAIWGPIIPIGLACASLSSALGSILVAPRTLQAIGMDDIFPNSAINKWFAFGKPKSNEPVNSSLITIMIAFVFVIMGDVNSVAKVISLFFMITYGAICLISFLEHFAADPSYRPTSPTKWYLSLLGALLSFWLMFKMNTSYAIFSVLIMAIIYMYISKQKGEKEGFANLFRGVLFQLSRQFQVLAQRTKRDDTNQNWRPFAICVSQDTFNRRSAFDLMRWISYKYGFGTYIHFIKGYLNEETTQESKLVLNRLIKLAAGSKNRVYLDTIISPSYTSAIAQVVQLSSISGHGNNLILFEFNRSEPHNLEDALNNYKLLYSTEFDVCILSTSFKSYGYFKEIHIWIDFNEFENAKLMILLAYILLGHPNWGKGIIKIFAQVESEEEENRKDLLNQLIKSGRLPISPTNIQIVFDDKNKTRNKLLSKYSAEADLILLGFNSHNLQLNNFVDFDHDLANILFVNAMNEKRLS